MDAEALADGDQITAFTYYDTAGYSDRYSFFTEAEKTVTAGEEFTLTLMSWGYDGNFNPVQAPVAAAPIGAYDLDTGTYSVPSAFRGEHHLWRYLQPNGIHLHQRQCYIFDYRAWHLLCDSTA